MSLDIKYRPINYDEVVGQSGTVRILKRIVSSGRGFHQSYLFTGQYGSGKTTLARILARALLCSDLKDGEPCNKCDSCVDIINNGYSESLTEIDAATNSGKDSVKQMIESLSYSTFSGKKRLWIIDEAHQLSRDASDSLLKSLEDTSFGTQERKMVCIFCTTEPEKMKETIGSRCGPVFSIRQASTQEITNRLKHVCENEDIKYEMDALEEIADRTGGHIRDALKTIESISLVSDSISVDSIIQYYGIDKVNIMLSIIDHIDNPDINLINDALSGMSPSMLYENLSKYSLKCFQISNGLISPLKYHDNKKMESVGNKHGKLLLDLSAFFASKPKKMTKDSVMCDMLMISGFNSVDKMSIDNGIINKRMSESEFLSSVARRIGFEVVKVKE